MTRDPATACEPSRAAQPSSSARTRPPERRGGGSSTEAIVAELAKVKNVLPSEKRSEGEWAQAIKLYVEALAGYPLDILREGLRDGIRRWQWFPKVAEICAVCDPLMAARREDEKRAREAAARAGQARIGYREDAGPVSPEVRQLVRAAAQRRRITFAEDGRSWEIGAVEAPDLAPARGPAAPFPVVTEDGRHPLEGASPELRALLEHPGGEGDGR